MLEEGSKGGMGKGMLNVLVYSFPTRPGSGGREAVSCSHPLHLTATQKARFAHYSKSTQPGMTSRQQRDDPLYLVMLEGSIGAGKTTALDAIKAKFEHQVLIQNEPIDEWTDAGAFQAMASKELSEETFQFMVLTSILSHTMQSIQEARRKGIRVIVSERSLFSGKHVFAKRAFKSEAARSAYRYALNCALSCVSTNVFCEFVYIRAGAQRCLERIGKRARPGEEDISFADLHEIVQLHDNWLIKQDNDASGENVHIIDAESSHDLVASTACTAVQAAILRAYA